MYTVTCTTFEPWCLDRSGGVCHTSATRLDVWVWARLGTSGSSLACTLSVAARPFEVGTANLDETEKSTCTSSAGRRGLRRDVLHAD